MSVFLGIDAGTTSLKAALFDLDGRMLALAREEYSLDSPAPTVIEIDAEIYWRACCSAVQAVIRTGRVAAEDIVGLAISSQGETLIPVDATGRPLRRAIVWMDGRAVAEAEALKARFDVDEAYHITGQPEITPVWPAAKLLWLKRHEPQVFAQAARFLLVEDFLMYRLAGQFVTDFSVHSTSMLVDMHRKDWWGPMLDFIGLSAGRLPRLAEPGTVVGPVASAAAQATGLSTRTLVVTGAMDQMLGAMGGGNIAPGVVTETTGGALVILVTTSAPHFDPARRVPCYYHARPDTYCIQPYGQTGGMALRWFRDQFYPLETQVAANAGLDPYDLLTAAAARVAPGCDGLVMLPHLEGAFTPEMNQAARAVFFGATLSHTRAHFTRAVLEAVAYMLKRNLDLVEGLGVTANEIRSLGGGARSDLWLQIKADVLQKPVLTVEAEESACLGAALLAATATGCLPSLEAGVARMVRVRKTYLPDPTRRAAYARGYARYVELYDRLEPMFV